MKPEQVPRELLQTPTLQEFGEGRRARAGAIDRRTSSGLSGYWARHACKAKCATRETWSSGIATRTRYQGWLGWESEGLMVPMKRVTTVEGRGPSDIQSFDRGYHYRHKFVFARSITSLPLPLRTAFRANNPNPLT